MRKNFITFFISCIYKKRNLIISSTLNDIRSQEAGEIVTCVIRALDVLNLVNALPAGVLWGGKLTPRQTAVMGTTSSLIGLYTVHVLQMLIIVHNYEFFILLCLQINVKFLLIVLQGK
jgi:hypothetical protein